MSNTGHRSLDGVRSYKRIGEKQKQEILKVLNGQTKKPKLEFEDVLPAVAGPSSSLPTSPPTLTPTSSCPPTITFDGCSSITINYNFH